MTDIEIRLAIAEFCGLTRLAPIQRRNRKGKRDTSGVVLWFLEESHGGADTWAQVPNYPNDLNAVHEAEKVLFAMDGFVTNEGYRTRYFDNLLVICRGGFHAGIHATARQRCEALLKTVGRWQSSVPTETEKET